MMLHLACLKGSLGYWEFYSTVMRLGDIVGNSRIITVSESKELYTNNINRVLQREISQRRVKALKDYIRTNDERFFTSLVVAIHKGEPKWTDIDLNRNFEVDKVKLDDESVNFLSSKFGVLSLTGSEEMFAVDGQHRLLSLRNALKEDPSLADYEVSVILVVHRSDSIEKTRRLFTVLNKYAEKPKGAELIILDEDDARAIVTRKLVTNHDVLSIDSALSESMTGSIGTSDNSSFTTLVTINKVNHVLYRRQNLYYRTRPADDELEEFYKVSKRFWDTLFSAYPELVDYIEGKNEVDIDGIPISRQHETGGSLLLRPVGQVLLAFAFARCTSAKMRADFKRKLRNIDFNLSSKNWKYLYWNEKMIAEEKGLKKELILYLFGLKENSQQIKSEMKRVYELNNDTYRHTIKPA